ncbi:MAG: YraN family protein [candidate division WOR-3 bacterium]
MIKSKNISKGKSGEILAIKYLRRKGFQILEQNFRFGKIGEIDIICKKDDTLVFVEVKSREKMGKGTPKESITDLKKERIFKCAKFFLMKHPEFSDSNFRFDFVGIKITSNIFKRVEIEHIENVFFFDEF